MCLAATRFNRLVSFVSGTGKRPPTVEGPVTVLGSLHHVSRAFFRLPKGSAPCRSCFGSRGAPMTVSLVDHRVRVA